MLRDRFRMSRVEAQIGHGLQWPAPHVALPAGPGFSAALPPPRPGRDVSKRREGEEARSRIQAIRGDS